MIEQKPLEACIQGWSAEETIQDVLLQAERKGQLANVAQSRVGAKLELRFQREVSIRFREAAGFGDFEIENSVIEVAMGFPSDDHINQVGELIENSDLEVWLLTRADRVCAWKGEIKKADGINSERIVVTSVAAFVGQSITELARFSAEGKAIQLEALFARYNSRWVEQVGTPAIRLVLK